MKTLLGFTQRKAFRLAIWKTLSAVVGVVTVLNVSLVGTILPLQVGATPSGGAGSIWTTNVSCGNPQDANHYKVGDHIFINYSGFAAGSTAWEIKGKPGGASGDPNSVVASGTENVVTGSGCFDAYTVAGDDWGEYQVKMGNKGDNYRVDGATVGSLLFTKVVDTGTASPDDFSFTISPDPQHVSVISTTGGTYIFEGLSAGTYAIGEEDGPNGYHTVTDTSTCDAVSVVAGQQATCVIHNARDTKDVTIIKDVVGSNAQPSEWTFTLTATGQDQGGPYTGIQSSVPVTVPTGTYALSESGPAGYTMSVDGNCYNDGGFFLYTNLESGNTCTVTNTYVPTQASLTVNKTVDGVKTNSAAPGATLNYAITVTNSGDLPATNVTITDTVPAHLTVITPIPDSGVLSSNTVTWTGITVPGHDSTTRTFQATIDASMPAGPTTLTNTAVLGCQIPTIALDSLSIRVCPWAELSSSATTTVSALPTISLDKQGPATVTAGNNITYTLAWSVNGNAPATNAVIIDAIPANTTFVSADNGGTNTAGTVTWNLGTKNPGDSGTVTLVVKSNSPLTNATVITNTGTFDTDQTDPVSDTATTTASSIPTLGLTKEASPTSVNPLTTITYTIKWSVAGNANATNVVITDPVPTNVTFVSAADSGVYNASTKTIAWTLGTKAPGTSGQVTWTGTVAANAPAGQIVNTASIDSAETDPAITANATVNVTVPVVLGVSTQPDLEITKTVDKSTARPNDVLTYTITVKNTGTENATNVVVTDTLPKDLSFVHATGRTMTWSVGTIKPGSSQNLTVEVRVASDAKKGEYVNTATAVADGVDQKQATATVTVTVPKVLGLATTGTGPLDYLIALVGVSLIVFGLFGLKSPKHVRVRNE